MSRVEELFPQLGFDAGFGALDSTHNCVDMTQGPMSTQIPMSTQTQMSSQPPMPTQLAMQLPISPQLQMSTQLPVFSTTTWTSTSTTSTPGSDMVMQSSYVNRVKTPMPGLETTPFSFAPSPQPQSTLGHVFRNVEPDAYKPLNMRAGTFGDSYQGSPDIPIRSNAYAPPSTVDPFVSSIGSFMNNTYQAPSPFSFQQPLQSLEPLLPAVTPLTLNIPPSFPCIKCEERQDDSRLHKLNCGHRICTQCLTKLVKDGCSKIFWDWNLVTGVVSVFSFDDSDFNLVDAAGSETQPNALKKLSYIWSLAGWTCCGQIMPLTNFLCCMTPDDRAIFKIVWNTLLGLANRQLASLPPPAPVQDPLDFTATAGESLFTGNDSLFTSNESLATGIDSLFSTDNNESTTTNTTAPGAQTVSSVDSIDATPSVPDILLPTGDNMQMLFFNDEELMQWTAPNGDSDESPFADILQLANAS